jgi:methyl-accepting chemotaxis protein/ABC-type sugar transport system substrate-binding protein
MDEKRLKKGFLSRMMSKPTLIGMALAVSLLLVMLLLGSIFFIQADDGGNITGAALSKAVFSVVIILAFAVSAILLLLLSKHLSSLDLINLNAKRLAKGDLNISDIPLEKTRGLELLTIAFNDMKSNLLSFIEMTKGNVIVLSDSIDKVSKSIEMSYKGNEQIAVSINHVAEKAQEQLSVVNQTIEGIEGISKRVEAITSNIANFEKYVEDTVTTTQAGTDNLDMFYGQLDTISENLDSTHDFIDKLSEDIKEITEVSDFIIRISEQLKLLGINASVEASKAGEFSKGFTVVANEINQLAAKTKEGIARIRAIVENIVKGSAIVSESINGCVANFNASRETFNTVKESFHTINDQSTVLSNDMKNIYTEINQINGFTKETNAKSARLHATSNEISSKTQEIASVTQEELAELDEIRHNTLSLDNMLVSIQTLINRFNTSKKPVAKNSAKKLNIAYLAPLDHAFWHAVRQGVLYAQKELAPKNAHVECCGMPPGYIEEDFVKAFKEYIDMGYDGFVIPGFFEQTIPIVNSLAGRGIPVIIFNSDLPKGTKRLAYYGPNTYEQGYEAGRLMIKALNGRGKVLMAGRNAGMGIHEERQRGFEDALKNSKKIQITARVAVEDSYESVYRVVKDYLAKDRDIDGIFVAGGGPTAAAKAIDEAGLKGRTRVVCFDHDKDIFEAIRDGIIYAAIGQDPFGQGHDPIIYLYNYLVAGEKPPKDHIPTRSDVVDSHNVNDLLEA